MTTEDSIQKASDGVKSFRKELRATKHRYRGREAEYLDEAKRILYTNIEWARELLIREIGYDIRERRRVSSDPVKAMSKANKTFLMLVERAALDAIAIGKTVALTMEAARSNNLDPILESYEVLFWATENVYSSGTVFLMLDFEGDEKEAMALLMSGWMDAMLEVDGLQARRLVTGLGVPQPEAREALRQELPSAVLQAAEEWLPGKELFTNDIETPMPGKKTLGRRHRSFKSRVSRRIELLAENNSREFRSKMIRQRRDWQGEASRRMAKPSYVKAPDKGAMIANQWKRLVSRAKLRGNELEIATYILSDLDCLTVGPTGRLKLEYGTQKVVARRLSRAPNQIRQETMRMFQKIEKAQREIRSEHAVRQ